jgi:hypothetical protein
MMRHIKALLLVTRGLPYFGAEEAASFWKRGSLRNGSNIGSSWSNEGVSGGFAARAPRRESKGAFVELL